MDEKRLKAVTALDLSGYVNGLLRSEHREAVSAFLKSSVPAASDCPACESGDVVLHRTPLDFLAGFFGCEFALLDGEDGVAGHLGVLVREETPQAEGGDGVG